MTAWTYADVDYSKAKPGDTIEDTIVIEIRERSHRESQITPEYRVTLGEYRYEFTRKGEEHFNGYSFPCDKDGNLLHPYPHFNDVKESGEYDDLGVQYQDRSFNVPAVIRCRCGGEVELAMVMTNTCDKCDRDYNLSGQLLAPRSQWGWDTGESASDILNADWGINDSVSDSVFEG